eukprot:TRINITY_DN106912_c0_g1_i1.p1 TRINITY_DN106912_c0_g1~~TRINITY_DN106912_c0_g1_i1.p1  ORF type:complete len:125 (+),score=24.24 TRINITY_DN106912_c0_g1_i1:52-426(+)
MRSVAAILFASLLMIARAQPEVGEVNLLFFDCLTDCPVNGQMGSDWCSEARSTEDCQRTKCDSAKCAALCGKRANCLEAVRGTCESLKQLSTTGSFSCDADCNGATTVGLLAPVFLTFLRAWLL